MDIFEAFLRNRTERPDSAAFLVTSGDRSLPITWRQFTDDIEVLASIIRRHAPGGAIGILGENSYEWMVAHAACLFANATAVPIEVSLSAREIADRLRFVGAAALGYSSLYAEKARDVGRLLPGLSLHSFGSKRTDEYLDVAKRSLAEGETGVFSLSPPDRRRTSMIVFTSGTTSEPRGVELAIEGLNAFCTAAESVLTMRLGDRSLMLLPLHHIFGICAAYLMLARGVALGICPDFRRIYDAFERFRVNYAFLVPALADILAAKISQHGDSAREALGGGIDWILVGGAPMPRRTHERLKALGIKAITAYGLTETTALYSVFPSDEDMVVGCAGKVPKLSSVEVAVSPEGELLIRGPNVMKGYYRMPERTSAVLSPDGWFRTGDFGRIDENGCVWVTGRASRTIVLSSGKKVAPEELEEILLSYPGIREALVSGESETRTIQAEIFAEITDDEVRSTVALINRGMPVHKRMNRIVIRHTPFARTSSGKIRLQPKPIAGDSLKTGWITWLMRRIFRKSK